MLRFEVRDTGIGIAPRRNQNSSTHSPRLMVQLSAGSAGRVSDWRFRSNWWKPWAARIGFDSREGEGSTFWFALPVLLPTELEVSESQVLTDLQGLRALVVDDQATNRGSNQEAAELLGRVCR
jgi:hypothetical protein